MPHDVHILAGDLGGSSLRVALVSSDLKLVAMAPVSDPMGAGFESDPNRWWDAFVQGANALARMAPEAFRSVAAVSITGATRTMTALDSDGTVLGPASTFRDSRAASVLADALARLPQEHPETASINAFHPLARLYRLQQPDPAIAGRRASIVDPKDFLNFRLTGELASDAVSSARLAGSLEPGPDGRNLAEALELPKRLLPKLLPPTAIAGTVRSKSPGALADLAGRPVLTMSHDSWAAVLGLGALRDGRSYNLSGTTEVFGVVSHRAAAAEGLLSVDWGGGLFQLGGPSLAGADTLSWALDLVGRGGEPVAQALDAVLSLPRGPRGLIVLPHLLGERVPFWNPDLRGAALGLSRSHGPGDLIRATLEGVAFLNRMVLARAETALGICADEIRFGGGGAASAAWAQIKADATGRPVCVTASPEPGLAGCALAALVALGLSPDLAQAQERHVAIARRFEPSEEGMAATEPLYRLFEQAEAVVAPLSEALARL